MDIHELFEAAGNLHGHLCPGLAIGVRAAAEAGCFTASCAAR